MVFFRAAGRNSITGISRVRGQFAPGNLAGIFVIDLANPALVRGDVLGRTRWIPVGPININYGVTRHCARMSEDRSSWNRSRLLPSILFGVINLNVIYRVGFRPAAYQIDVAVTVNTGNRVLHRDRHVGTA